MTDDLHERRERMIAEVRSQHAAGMSLGGVLLLRQATADAIEIVDREHRERTDAALALIFTCGGVDGAHHKMWTLDQVARILAGDRYADLRAVAQAGDDGPETYAWDEGIAP